MMRRWHRWVAVLFGLFLLWVSVTGLLSQIVPLVQRGGFEGGGEGPRPSAAASAMPPGFACPATLSCRPKAQGQSIVGTLHHLHSGESFGPIGQIVSILSGFALLFFTVSGLWMYIQMFRGRLVKARGGKPPRGGRWFWK